MHNIQYAQKSELIKDIYVSTDCPYILKYGKENNYHIINRPKHLTTDNCSHQETMVHGLYEIEKREECQVDILVILFGNSLGALTEDLDGALQYLIDHPETDSVQSVSKFNMYNPFRAMKIDQDGLISSFIDPKMIYDLHSTNIQHSLNDKDAAGDVYYFNGSFWICRRDALLANNGLPPFPWLGNNIKGWVQDVFLEIDAPWQAEYTQNKY